MIVSTVFTNKYSLLRNPESETGVGVGNGCLLYLKNLKNRNQVDKEGWKKSLVYYKKIVFLRSDWKVFL